MPQKYKHLFGPVPSRRFNRSLGVDLTPFKTCCFDCIFCQLGKTLNRTNARKEYISTKEIKSELNDWFEEDGQADYITMAGSGEPTLHTHIGEIISHIKTKSRIPVAVLTNGYLLQNEEVRKSLLKADTVKISLSAWDNSSLQQINRPYDTNFDSKNPAKHQRQTYSRGLRKKSQLRRTKKVIRNIHTKCRSYCRFQYIGNTKIHSR